MKTGRRVICLIISFTLLFNISSSAFGANIDILLNNIGSHKPLIEYTDPIEIAENYTNTIGGRTELFLVNFDPYNVYTLVKGNLWEKAYEKALVDIISDKTLLKQYSDARPEDLLELSSTVLGLMENAFDHYAIETALPKYKTALDVDKIIGAIIKDGVKIDVLKSQVKVEIISMIMTHTKDKNLKSACENCLNYIFSNTVTEVSKYIVENLVGAGLNAASAKAAVNTKVLQTAVSKQYQYAISALGSVANGLSLAFAVVDVIKISTLLTGVKSKTDALIDIVSKAAIHQGAVDAYVQTTAFYKKTSKRVWGKRSELLFDFILATQRSAYEDIEKLIKTQELNNKLSSDPNFKKRYNKISKLSITNYKVEKYRSAVTNTNSINNNKNITFSIAPKKKTLYRGAKYKLKTVVNGFVPQVKWKSQNSKIVTVTQNGVITGKKAGTTKVTATIGTKKAVSTVKIINPTVKLNVTKTSLRVNGSKQLKATVKGPSSNIIWSTNKPAIVTVNKNGKITAKKTGKATVTARANGATAKCVVTVKKNTASSILNQSQMKSKISKLGKIARWHYVDFDGNGKSEAFAVIVDSSNCVEAVYYIDSSGKTKIMMDKKDLPYNRILYTSVSKCYYTIKNKVYFTFTHNNNGTTYGDRSELFGVKNGNPYRLNISGTISGMYRENGNLFTISHRTDQGFHMYMAVELLYDEKNQQFYKGNDIGPNSGAYYDAERFA